MRPQICDLCHAEFTPTTGPSKNRRQRFCSHACKGLAIRGANHYNFKGGSVQPHGYRMICVDGRRVYEHRHVLAQHLGRPLLPGEVVHHKDGNRSNNEIGNLELMPSQSVHSAIHFSGYRSETHKQCRKCRGVKERSQFDKGQCRGQNIDPNHTECKACRSAYYAERWRLKKTGKQRRAAVGDP